MRAKIILQSLLAECIVQKGYTVPEKAEVAPPADKRFGDLAANHALVLAKQAGQKTRDLALAMVEYLLEHGAGRIAKAEIAGPGFINVAFEPAVWQEIVLDVLAKGDAYGRGAALTGKKIQVEYVSANPTGPLHIGHGRGAALGDSLARLLRFAGAHVLTEYYINDAGVQMRILGESVRLRLAEKLGQAGDFPDDHYRGDYIADIAADVLEAFPDLPSLPEDEAREICQKFAADSILSGIKADLAAFRVGHDVWFSEKSLVESGAVKAALEFLGAQGMTYTQDGALFCRTTQFGDDKDRVLVKSDGSLTYFASDVAYHKNKYDRGFDLVVDVLGADHHGYVGRMKAAAQALGRDKNDLEILLIKLVNLLSGGEQISMSTRAGTFETLADVLKEVGPDAARFIFLTRKADAPLDFDLELVKQKSMDNPVFYVQYAYARIRSLGRKALEQDFHPGDPNANALAGLVHPLELDLLKRLDAFPELVASAAQALAPHHISHYLTETAQALHRFYTELPVLAAPEPEVGKARLHLARAVGQVLHNGLDLLGVSAPDTM